MNKDNDRKTERENISNYIKIFTYFIAIFSVIIMIISLAISIDRHTKEKKIQDLENTIKLSNTLSNDNINVVDDIIEIPGYSGKFVILTDKDSRPFSPIQVGYFTDTKVMYSINSYNTLTLLVNSDGTPMLYDKN